MRLIGVVSSALLAACLVLPNSVDVFAGNAKKATTTSRKKASHAPTSALPAGAARAHDVGDAYDGGAKIDTIKEYRNELGQTVYSIAASHFDISPPLLEMAAAGGPEPEIENEAPTNPQLPAWRSIRSDVPDPVVQSVIPPGNSSAPSTFPLAAPTTGFNFLGIPKSGTFPSDSNGSVGNNQFVEVVNTRYQVWSLNHSTKVATSVVGPNNINTLWAGFGGACQVQNSGDPIVLFDKVANRWLISQFTFFATAGVYFECVAVSTTANATGSYARYAFAVPGGQLGDYPKFGVWADAYYMMADAVNAPPGGGLFAALDRTKMLAGDPAATWQVIQDPNEGGHMPADLDGFALPPTNAPGIFLSLYPSGMVIYRMKVDFVTPANTVRIVQATVPVAPSTAACNGSIQCIPQPSTPQTVASLGNFLMFRAAYRNFIDHESLVISHSVDPSVSGVASGVRWYDFRLSGTPDATCPTYPCIYQQGTIADVPDGRSRWMPSIAMDTAENILVGYSTSGKTAGTENHSIRYTGRAKADSPGVMTVPETTIATGTANDSTGRWGDYTSMSIDPFDDCTFWYVNQYELSASNWSTQIASAAWPAGSAPGQCPATTCTARPATAPTIGSATVPGDNQITITWTGVTPTPGAYAIERAEGVCGSEGLYRPLAATAGTASSFTDTTVAGGLSYAYRVIAAKDAAGKCQSLLASGCVNATATGTCDLRPSFAGATGGASSQQSNCGVTVSWTPAVSGCPLTPNVRYNIFRGIVPDFVPSVGNRIATCVVGPSSYLDAANLQSGVTYYYVVRAVDSSTGNGGECGGGNEESNTRVVPGTAYGAGTQAAPGTWTDGGGDGSAFLLLNVASPEAFNLQAWRLVKTANDPGANHTPGGAYAYRNAGPAAGNKYNVSVCAEMQAPPLTVGVTTVNLQYWERHQLEYHLDGVAVEYAVNGGAWTDVPAPSNDTALGCDASDDTTGWETLSCTDGEPRFNGCAYHDTKNVFTGPLAGGESCIDWQTNSLVTAYAHRCHQITGLIPDDTIQFRWRFTSDQGAVYAGFYLDDISVTNIRLPNTCTPDTCAGQVDGTACADGDACTTADTCGGGTCQGGSALVCDDNLLCTTDSCSPVSGCFHTDNAVACDDGNPCTDGDVCGGGVCNSGSPITAPPETGSMSIATDKATYSWSAVAFATRYDVVRGSLAALPVGPSGGDEVCFDDLPNPSLGDPAVPAANTGFWYLSRGENACDNGSYGQRSDGTSRVTTTCP